MSKQIRIPVDGGHLAAIDHGGPGRPMLLVHGSGHNAAAWNALAAHLAPRYRIVALDLRGHGQSTAESTTAEQYWRDLAAAVARSSRTSPSTTPNAAGVTRPAAVTAVTAYPPVECPINSGRRQPSVWITVEQVGAIDNDWLNAGAQPALVREVASRCLLLDGAGRYLRRPTTDEIAATTAAEPHTSVYPSVDVMTASPARWSSCCRAEASTLTGGTRSNAS